MEKNILMFLFTILFINCILPVFTQRWVRQQVQYCNTPDNKIGVCTTLNNCPSVGLIFAQGNRSPQTIQYIKGLQRNCGTRSINGDPVVCCQQAYRGQQRITTQPPTINRPVATRRPQRITTQPPVINRPVATRQPPIRISTAPPYVDPFEDNVPLPIPTSIPQIEDIYPPTEDTVPLPIPTSLPPTPETRANQYCVGPDAKAGTCKALQQCPALISALSRRRNDPEFVEFLRYSNKICESTYSYVCCPGEETEMRVTPSPVTTSNPITNGQQQNLFLNRLPTIEDGCGRTNATFKKIVGGAVAQLGTWPWIALLGYGDFDDIQFKCGGSLITQKHVLTAAHCLRNNLVLVRLGEHDLSTDTETNHVDVRIERSDRHPQYFQRDGYADIAVLYLEQPVQFTNLIKPVCLPKSVTLRTKSYVRYSPFVAGWGRTQEGGESALVLQQLQIPIHENSVCVNSYKKAQRYISQRQFGNTVLCAGVLSGGKDTCQGDSGGPLVIPENIGGTFYYYEIGIVSYGVGCARADIPGVYTSVQYFVDWIEQKVLETR